ncbi:hypothetical protein [Parahaliea mediterranea]|uniref:hypothetical protein n=1 Tax=Parahaliea mediterranea TaxID=651086 RepID=UPI0013007D64|nr:hypothetical protein [Parahaliea mediterranea]
MSDDSGISYSFQMNTPPGQPAPAAEAQAGGGDARNGTGDGNDGAALYAADDIETLSVAGGTLLIGKSTGAQLFSQPEVATVLQYCTVFRTLRDHAKTLVAAFPQLGGNVDDALRVLGLVRDAGLMVSANALCERVNKESAQQDLDRSKAFIITCDRPEAVQRLLESLLHKAKLATQKQLYLIDDSRQVDNARANAEAVERFNLQSPASMQYFGPEQQAELIAQLGKALPDDSEAVRFLFSPQPWQGQKTYGRARNLCLLLSVGERCIVMDDDVLCMALAREGSEPGMAVADGMREAEFYAGMVDWQQRFTPQDFDPLVGHGRFLGLSAAQLVRALGGPLQPEQLAGASLALFRDLHADAPVLVTQSGTVGDPGTVNNAWVANLGASSVRSMLARPGGLAEALATRHCWLGQARTTVSKRAVMSQVTGLDNRAALPPYFPALRGEDQLFGAMLDFLIPDSLVVEYAWAVPHLPVEERRGNPEGDSVVPRGGLQLLGAYLAAIKPQDAGVSYETRLQLLAARLDTLAQLSTASLVAQLRASLTRAQGFALQTINDRLAETGALDSAWTAYLEKNAKACIQALQHSAQLTDLPDVVPGTPEETVATTIRQRAAGFAAALRAWPRIRAAAHLQVN